MAWEGKEPQDVPTGERLTQLAMAVPGRKTDVKDAEWIPADLLKHGLLRGSFVPERSQRELRVLTRYRRRLIQQRSQAVTASRSFSRAPILNSVMLLAM